MRRSRVAVGLLTVVGGLVIAAAGFAIRDNPGTPTAWSTSPTLPGEPTLAPTTAPPTTAPATTAPSFPQSGSGTFRKASGSAKRVGKGGRLLRYRVEVERGLEQDPVAFAKRVDEILADQRGWTAGGRWSFQRPAAGPVDFIVKLATPDTVDRICGAYGLDTDGEVSCRGQENVIINVKRWLLGTPTYKEDVPTYQHLVVNHEVGHFLGKRHVPCPGKGQLAPVMQTQIFGMNGCLPNAWPYPDRG
jgi:Protein of unknown function (DUF3152)